MSANPKLKDAIIHTRWFGFLKYYSTALVPLLMLFEISGARLLYAQKFIDAK